jgi:hypothetical protein
MGYILICYHLFPKTVNLCLYLSVMWSLLPLGLRAGGALGLAPLLTLLAAVALAP